MLVSENTFRSSQTRKRQEVKRILKNRISDIVERTCSGGSGEGGKGPLMKQDNNRKAAMTGGCTPKKGGCEEKERKLCTE